MSAPENHADVVDAAADWLDVWETSSKEVACHLCRFVLRRIPSSRLKQIAAYDVREQCFVRRVRVPLFCSSPDARYSSLPFECASFYYDLKDHVNGLRAAARFSFAQAISQPAIGKSTLVRNTRFSKLGSLGEKPVN
jgi:hypothetical protein